MRLKILDIIRTVDIKNDESILAGTDRVYHALLDFAKEDSSLINNPEPPFDQISSLQNGNIGRVFDRGFDITDGLEELQAKWVEAVGELLFYCAAMGIPVE